MVKFIRTVAVSAFAIALCCAPARAFDLAESLFKAGEKAERAGDTFHAYLLYARAAAADPHNATYAAKKTALRGIAMLTAREELGPDPAGPDPDGPGSSDFVSDDDANGADADADARDLRDARQALAVPHLIALPEKKTFDLKGDARSIFEKVAGAYEINVVFDADYQAVAPFTFRMNDADYREALRGLEAASDSFLVPIGPKLALVSRDTTAKRAEHEPVTVVSIPIPERLSAQEATELVQAIQQTMEVRRISLDPSKHHIIIRDRESKVMAAEHILEVLSRARPQVEVEVDLLEVDKTSSLNYGMNLPNDISLVNFSNFLHNTVAFPSGVSNILQFGGGSTLMGIGITSASAFATIAKATTNNLLEAQVVSLDGQPVSLHVGQHYPVASNAYIGNTAGTPASQVFTPPPTINFEDLGLVLKITPSIHADDEVTLDIDAEFKVLGASTAVGIPIISNRKFVGKVRLKDGEWAVVAGLVSTTDSDTLTGFPGLSRIPFLRRLFGQTDIEKDRTDVLLILKPRLTNLPPWDFPHQTIWVGTDTRPLTVF
jgi:general secretion pathway protein D